MDYYSLDLQITKEPEGFLNLYRASILENGDIKATQTFKLRRDLKLIKMLEDLEEKAVIPLPQPKETVHIEFGKMLHDTVFSGELGDYFNKRFSEVQEENCGLRVSMQLNDDVPEITTLPWEYLHNGEEFLAVKEGILFSRLPAGLTKTKFQPIGSILRMLVIISSPDDPRISSLNTEKEQEIILESVDKLQNEQRIKVDFAEDATLENIQGYLNEKDYHIVHFTGHGISINGKGHIVLETKDRKAKLIDNKTLANLFSGKGIRLVVLSSCESAKGSNKEAYGDVASVLLKQGIPAVVAMQYSVLDDVAIQFAFNFYKSITNEDSVDLALKKARVIMNKSEKSNGFDFATPVLYLSDCNCVKVEKIKPEPAEFENKPMMLHDLHVMKKGFVARKKELRNLERDFRSDVMRVAIIHSLGGMGKTVLATRLALKMNEYFDGIFGMRCTSTTRPEDILVKVNNFFIMKGMNELDKILDQQVPIEEKTSLLVDIFNQKRFLLIFDNFEDCLNEDRNDIENPELKAFIQQILNNTIRNTKFLITTRYDFDPLEGRLASRIKHISLPELRFPQTNWLINSFTELSDLGIRKKKEIYDVVGGNPWIIGQFAKRAVVQGVDDFLLDLQPLKKELIEFTLLDKSYSKLDEEARKLLLFASIYEEAIPIEALSWIVGDEKDESPSIGESLNNLLKWGLISKEHEYNRNVYSLHVIVKDFARKKLKEDGLDKKKLLIRAARYYENLATQSNNLWDYLKARDYYFQAEDWESANNIVEGTVDTLIRWGHIELAKNLLKKSIDTTSEDEITNAEYILATIYYRLGDLTTALKIYNKVIHKYKNRGDNRGVAVVLHAIGIIYKDQGNYEEAVKKYKEALKIDEEMGNKRGIAAILHSFGTIFKDQGNYEEAVKKYIQSFKIEEELGNKRGAAYTLHQLGTIYKDQGDYEKAVKMYNESLITLEEFGDKNGIATTLHQLGMIHQDQGNYEEAVELYNQSLKIDEELGDKSGIAKTFFSLGTIHRDQGNYEEAVKKYNQSLKIEEELGGKRGIVATQHALGSIHQDQGNYKQAVEKYNQCLKIAEELGDTSGVARILQTLGNINYLQGNYEEAVKLYNQSLKIEEGLGNKSGVAATQHALGMIHQDQGNYEEAVKLYNKSLKTKEDLGDKKGIASTFHQLGNIYCLQGNYEEAVKKYSEALTTFEELGDKSGTEKTLSALGSIYNLQCNYEEAAKKYNQSLEIAEELGNKSGIAGTLHNLGVIHQDHGNYEEAVKLYNKSLKIKEELGDKKGIASTFHQLGMIHQDQGNYEEAVKLYNQSQKINEELGDKKGTASTLHQLGMIHEYQGNYEEATKKYNEALITFEELGDKRGTAATLHALGSIYCLQCNYEQAVKKYNEALITFEELEDRSRIAGVLHSLGNIHHLQGNYEEAEKMYEQSLIIKEELGDKSGIATTQYAFGTIHQNWGNYEEAIKKYNQALITFENLGAKRETAIVVHALGNIYCLQGNYEEAIKKYNQVLIKFEELADKSGIAGTLHNLGVIHQNHGNYEEAVNLYNQSLKINEELGDKSGIADILHALGTIFQHQGSYEEAEKMYEQSLIIKEELRDKSGIAITVYELGNLHRDQGNYEEAVKLYDDSVIKFNELGDKIRIAGTLYQIGRINEKEEDCNSALRNYSISFSIFEQLNSPNKEIVAISLLRLRDKMGEEKFHSELESLVKNR